MDNAKPVRNSGIDFLRLFSMFLVVLLHTANPFIFNENIETTPATSLVLYFLFFAPNCCVNCFALISGYLGVNKSGKISKIAWLWVRVLIGGLLSCAFISIFFPTVFSTEKTAEMWIGACFPVLLTEYWYFTSYVLLFFLAPYYNHLVASMTKKQHLKLLVILLVAFSVIPTFVQIDVFWGGNGVSFCWLSVMYLLGAYIKKYGIFPKTNRFVWLLLYFLCVALQIGCCLYTKNVVRYNRTPLTVAAAVFLFLFFEKAQFSNRSVCVLAKLAPLSFGIYLVHAHQPFWAIIEHSEFFQALPSSPILTFCKVLVLAVVIFVGSGVVEFVLSKFIVLLQRCCSYIIKRKHN